MAYAIIGPALSKSREFLLDFACPERENGDVVTIAQDGLKKDWPKPANLSCRNSDHCSRGRRPGPVSSIQRIFLQDEQVSRMSISCTSQELISGRELNSAAVARRTPNLPGNGSLLKRELRVMGRAVA